MYGDAHNHAKLPPLDPAPPTPGYPGEIGVRVEVGIRYLQLGVRSSSKLLDCCTQATCFIKFPSPIPDLVGPSKLGHIPTFGSVGRSS